jgi:tetratricopeptide (TPR) repeat protein
MWRSSSSGWPTTTRLADRGLQARAHRTIAIASFRLGRLGDADTHLRRCLELGRDIHDPAITALGHVNLAVLRGTQGRHDEALEHARQGLDYYEADGDRRRQARVFNLIGWQHTRLGQPAPAVAACRRALALLEELSDPHAQGLTWDTLGRAYYQHGDYRQAIASYERAIALLRDSGERFLVAEVLDGLGDAYHAMDDAAGAREAWSAAIAIATDFERPEAELVRGKLRDLDTPRHICQSRDPTGSRLRSGGGGGFEPPTFGL